MRNRNGQFMKGSVSPRKGVKLSDEIKRKMAESRKGLICGKKHYNWKGDAASYIPKHAWIARHFGRPDICEICGAVNIPEGKKRWFEWANISGKYKRDRSDWRRLCKKCHAKVDDIINKSWRTRRNNQKLCQA